MGKRMVKEHLLFLGEESMKVNTRMGNKMVKEQKLTLVEVCMLVNGRMGENMVKEHTLNMVLSFTLMGESMWGNTRMGKSGTEHITTITGKKNTSW